MPSDPADQPGLTSLARLLGDWDLRRVISHADGQVDKLRGTCRFERSGPRVLQTEQGVLETSAGRFEAKRRYVWTESEGRIDVYFEDMKPFHAITLNVPEPKTVHLCPPDRYAVAYDFGTWPQWQSTWSVEGPRKNYVMTNQFVPADGPITE